MATRTDYFKLHFIVFLWGFSAILGKLVTIPPVEMIFYRSLLAAIGLGLVIIAARGTFTVTTKELLSLILIGCIVAVHWVAFFASARVANVSVSLVGFATNSLWAAILEPWFNRSRIKKFELLLGLIVMFGLYVIFSFDFAYKFGLLLGVFAGFTAALFSVLNSKLVRTIPAFTISFYEMVGAFVALGLFMTINSMVSDAPVELVPAPMDWVYIALLAGACSVYAYSTAVELMKRLSVFLIQLSLNLEPVYGIIMAVIIFGNDEKMSTKFYIGTTIILAAVLLYPVLKRRYERQITLKM
jgi:drug/metabolite transporter (DMT)-like permease